ncbi:hypothetical protein [Halobacteriovorax sp. DPLXC-1]|uniref:hypothetical protein n=1 Tax=Halobacteriovorax sp. DPLXC-1 TaxID=3110771 RepID=UPI002FEE965E
MKIALCIYGKYNNRLSPTSGDEGFNYIYEQLLSKYSQIDVFIHSWDIDLQDKITNKYKKWLRDSSFENQIDFNITIKNHNIDESVFQFPGQQNFRTISNSLSFFYSRAQAIKLKRKYEQNNSIIYDSVIVTRFDTGQMDKYNGYQPWKVSELVYDPEADMNYIYSAMWNQLNDGFADMWFYSSSANIDILATMYEKSLEYYKKDSEYLSMIQKGLPDSNPTNIFSNEVLSSNKSKKLKKFKEFEGHNNHLIHKYFMIDSGLYKKSKYVGNMSTKVCSVMYSHTDYSDVWPCYFQQKEKHCPVIGPKFIFINKYSEEVPTDYEQIIYDENKSYPEKIHSCLQILKNRGFEVCLFEHEDMILYKDVDFIQLKQAIETVLKPSTKNFPRNGLDSIRLIKASQCYSFRSINNQNIKRMLPFSKWLYSVQPTIWKIDKFSELMGDNFGDSIWELEISAQKTIRKKGIKCGYLHSHGRKAGLHHWDNAIYPYVATAIVKGKWNMLEYADILSPILKAYNVSPDKRGTV